MNRWEGVEREYIYTVFKIIEVEENCGQYV